MSKQMKILVGAVAALVLVAVVLTMFGKPPNLPLGPLQGMLAKDAEPAVTATDGGLGTDPGLGAATDCADGTGLGATDPAAGGATDPVTGQPVDPAAGGAADPTAGGTIDPATGQPVDPAAGGAVDPATGAPVAAPAEGWSGDSRVSAAGAGSYDASRVSDARILAADAGAVDPATGLPVDPAAGAVDPATGQPVDPAAGGATDPAAGGASIDPGTGAATDPAAGGALDPAAGGVTDPCADPAAGGITDPAAGGAADPAAGGAGATGGAGTAGAGAGAGAAATKSTTDGSSTGNTPEALRAAKDATTVMQKAKITVTTTATLVPSAGGIGRPAAVKRYRRGVTGAVLVMKLDTSAQQQWTGAGKKVQTDLVRSFIKRLGKSYPRATRSITIVDSAGTVLALGDAAPRAAGTVKLY